MQMLILFISVVSLTFGFVIILGAPYLPSRRRELQEVMAYININDTVYELGTGDGRVQIFLARHKIKSIGIELNPILFFVCWLRLRPYKKYASVKFGNFWSYNLSDADVVYVFLLQKYMNKLYKKIIQDKNGQKCRLISIGFALPGQSSISKSNTIFTYDIN